MCDAMKKFFAATLVVLFNLSILSCAQAADLAVPPSVDASSPSPGMPAPVAGPITSGSTASTAANNTASSSTNPSANTNMGESFARPTYQELTHAMIMLGGMDISEPKVTEEYAKLMYCDLWRQSHNNDFEWQRIRDLVVSRAQAKKDYFRIQYQMEGPIYLGKYDFNTQDFPLTPETALNRVGSMVLMEYDAHSLRQAQEKGLKPLCDDSGLSSIFPRSYVLMMNQPFTFDRLKISKDDAKQLLDKMDAAKNTQRQLFVRFRFRIQSVERLDAVKDLQATRVMMHGELASVDVFLDYALTKYLTSIPLK